VFELPSGAFRKNVFVFSYVVAGVYVYFATTGGLNEEL
jgi:uncharacterized membrane protein (DUF485 family)